MLRSFAEAARVLGRDDYRASAERTADFLLTTMNSSGRLLRSYRDGQAKLKGYLEDYANLGLALLELYQTTHNPRWFSAARQLADQMNDLFWDEEDGGFFSTGNDHEELVGRPKELMDNATPSGNSSATELLLRLAAYTGEDSYRSRAETILRPLVPAMAEHPSALSQMLIALDFSIGPTYEVVIIGDPAAADTRALLTVISSSSGPIWCWPSPNQTTARQSTLCHSCRNGLSATARPRRMFARTLPARSRSRRQRRWPRNCKHRLQSHRSHRSSAGGALDSFHFWDQTGSKVCWMQMCSC